jgi:uncharacterized membrane protein YagU involved in acid resistance
MNISKLVVAWLVVGVVMNVLDILVHGVGLSGYYAQMTFMRHDMSVTSIVVTEFVFALVFVVVYDRLYATTTTSVGRGAAFGFWTGLLLSFPANIGMYVMINGFPYWLSWVWTLSGMVTMTVGGAVAGGLYARRAVGAKPAIL